MDCVFCKIANKELPAKVVFENDRVLAFDDIKPVHPVHVVIIPKKHISNINEAGLDDKEWLAEMMLAVALVAKVKGVDKTGYRLIVNYGKDAGMSVNHLHIHLVGGEELPFATA
ncbi:MAG: histidine triad nucleotide-binding protein [Candidatus Pacebacteria bacterium]|jgi:histidine triad (HIT) family protein|nr:histidine triad nucleotide-binding protein [Candidatus Paceibacterota bacterium]